MKLLTVGLLLALLWLVPEALGTRAARPSGPAPAGASGPPDLVLAQVSVSPAVPPTGTTVSVSYTVSNEGGIESLPAGVHAFLTPRDGGPETDLGSLGQVPPLSPGRSVTQAGHFTLSSVPAGNYLLRIQADWPNANGESAEWNNSQVRSLTVSPYAPTATPVPPVPVDSGPFTGHRTPTPTVTRTPDGRGPELITATPTPGAGTPQASATPDGTTTPAPTAAAASPFTGRLAYVNGAGSSRELFLVNGADPSTQLRLTDKLSPNSGPAWSPDGSRVAFAARQDTGAMAIQVSAATGTSLAVIRRETDCDRPSWSPDSTRLAFSCVTASNVNRYDLFTADASGSDVKQLTATGVAGSPAAWSPDGTQLAFSPAADLGLYLIKSDGTSLSRLSDLPGTSPGSRYWSADGRSILFRVDYFGVRTSGFGLISTRTYVAQTAGSLPVQMGANHRHVLPYGWNRTGDRVYLHGSVPSGLTDSAGDQIERYDIVDAARDGSVSTNLTNHPADDALWGIAPDGSQLFFASDREGFYELYTMDRDGSNVRKLTDRGGNKSAAALSPDGKLVAFVAGEGEQTHVFLLGGAETPYGQVSVTAGKKSELSWASAGAGGTASPNVPADPDS